MVDPRVFQSLPTGLQHQPLLGIEQLGLNRRNAEERGVELVDVVHQSAEAKGIVVDNGVGENLSDSPLSRTGNPLCNCVLALFQ